MQVSILNYWILEGNASCTEGASLVITEEDTPSPFLE